VTGTVRVGEETIEFAAIRTLANPSPIRSEATTIPGATSVSDGVDMSSSI